MIENNEITFADLFAGGGGTSTGAYGVPGICVKWAINHDENAIKTHAANHPETKHYMADIRTQDVSILEPVNIIWASLECTDHSKAKGGQSKNIGSFMLGWELMRYLIHCNPETLIIENVPEFIRWGELDSKGKRIKSKEGSEYIKWIAHIKKLGWVNYEYRMLNAADYGAPTRRIRYIGIFTKKNIPITFPYPSHSKDGGNGLKKWIACRDYINLEDEGNSIFGRAFNKNIRPNHRKPLCNNTLKRIAGGVKKFSPDLFFILKYYSTGGNSSSIEEPLHTITTKDRHALIKCEKIKFITDHCYTDSFNKLNEPLKTQLTRQTKQLITIDSQFIADYYGRDNTAQSLDKPSPTITCSNSKHIITTKFISPQYNSNGKPEANNQSIDEPLKSITTKEKFQFISAYFNSNNNPKTQNQSIDKPLNSTQCVKKHALVSAIENNIIDFDIKMRFLNDNELAEIMGFPDGYFKNLGLSRKEIIKLIGNAVPTQLAKAIIKPVKEAIENSKHIKPISYERI